ncbi:uncharacterized protein HfgLR_12875 [Haloferax gibbonsii]|uniref:Uncharacterized protein n=1 Tax=Haloferax gibbonsii TaxID=35746 RepID=A0A871BHT1_HALGI|nr:uncharacterized protein HfgLR_12875 [Haloferax gibbonsii]
MTTNATLARVVYREQQYPFLQKRHLVCLSQTLAKRCVCPGQQDY